MVTLKMLAQACNVSIATVSKALNGAPDIGLETAARIQKTDQIIQRVLQHFKLPIALDSNRLKGLLGGMSVNPHLRRDGSLNNLV